VFSGNIETIAQHIHSQAKKKDLPPQPAEE
jgi:hypothetical protein